MTEKNMLVGKAVYMELRNNGYTYQIIITPDGVSSTGRAVPATMYRRRLSVNEPRKTWRTFGLPSLPLDSFGAYEYKDEEYVMNMAYSRLEHIANTMNQIKSYGYQLYKAPLIIEVSQEDIEQIRVSKTPYKILGRVTRVRRTLGFSEELFIKD